ncbi:MAG: hypothetical protein BWY57_01949 [Betaproteobacteria bacterium ADurb.Bin341]|nr:MAG: hypothetical protein BWY57_01949 [Betaproteobacteria bacterium ADurb.Bin341]
MRTDCEWRGRDALPPGSLLELICDSFSRGTNIPLEIPLVLALHLISGVLLQRGVRVRYAGGELSPRLWTIVLADSSAGKTFTYQKLLTALGVQSPEIPGMAGAVSAAAFFATLHACPQGLLVRDEFGQLVGRIEHDISLSDYKDLYLRLYDGNDIPWTTKKEGALRVQSPEVSVLGLTQYSTWHQKVSAESMLDGFAARFSVIIARPDPARSWRDYPTWVVDTNKWAEAWGRCERVLRSRYGTTAKAEEYFARTFRALAKDTELPEPFFRRIMYSAHRLACIYHVLLEDEAEELSPADYAWALRIIRHHITDSVEVMGNQNVSEIERLIQGAEALRERCHAKGETFNERRLYQNFRALTPQTAAVILRLLHEKKHDEYTH